MKKNMEAEEILQARAVNLEMISNIKKLLSDFKVILLKKQPQGKVEGRFLFATLFLRYLAEFLSSDEFRDKIENAIKDNNLTPIVEDEK